jgi:hypothetical protein
MFQSFKFEYWCVKYLVLYSFHSKMSVSKRGLVFVLPQATEVHKRHHSYLKTEYTIGNR